MGSNCDNIRILLKQMKSSDKVLGSKKSKSVMEVIYVIPNLSKIWKKGCWNFIHGLSNICMDNNILCKLILIILQITF